MFKKLLQWFSHNDSFVIADPRDNSITFSKALARMLELDSLKEAKVFAFSIKKVGEKSTYGFTLNPKLEQETQLADIMYNSKHRCVGFECLNPTVNRIFYDYGINHFDKPCKLAVKKEFIKPTHLVYYEIVCPAKK